MNYYRLKKDQGFLTQSKKKVHIFMTTILDWTKIYRTYTKLDSDSVARNSNDLKAQIILKLYGLAAQA